MEDSCGRKGIGETPQVRSTRRLTSRPRKAKCVSVAMDLAHIIIKSYVAVYRFYDINNISFW
ncbi:hypothetical protein CIT14_12035 [Virgibacillus profundi]|nr:hypothetical protein CIT14_12035 [Virgibacillus profundi]